MCGHISLVRIAFRLLLGTQDVNFSAQPNFHSGFPTVMKNLPI